MPIRLKVLAAAAAVAAMSSAAMAQCPPGYALYGNVCQPVPASPYPSNPVSGAMSGGAAGAAAGAAAGGPVGAIVGGAVGTATGTVTGTVNAVTGGAPAPTCPPGLMYYNGACYPAR